MKWAICIAQGLPGAPGGRRKPVSPVTKGCVRTSRRYNFMCPNKPDITIQMFKLPVNCILILLTEEWLYREFYLQ